MKRIQRTLIVLLVFLAVAHIVTSIYETVSGRDDAPTVSCPSEILDVYSTDPESVLLQDVTASDPQDGDLTNHVILGGKSKLIDKNTAVITYHVFDSDNNMGTCTRRIRYVDYHRPQFSIMEPLIYAPDEEIQLLSRVSASDVVDGDLSDQIRLSTLVATNNSEVYMVTVQVTNSIGDTSWVKLPVLVRETNPPAPSIELTSYLIYLDQGSSFDPSTYVSSVTMNGESLPVSNVLIDNTVDTSVAGTYQVTYTYPSSSRNGTAFLTVVVQ